MKWASPTLAVPKRVSNKLRFTVDLRVSDKQTVPVASAIPDLEGMYRSVVGSTVFAKIVMCHAYCQIPLDPESQYIMSIQIPLGLFAPTGILQGSNDAGNHFQSVTSLVFNEIDSNLLQWLDNFLLHAKSEKDLLRITTLFFSKCHEKGFRVHANKTTIFSKAVRFCRRKLDASGIIFDPRTRST